MSKILVPLHVTNFSGSVGSVDPGFKKFYLKNGYFKVYDGLLVSDLVLDRPLDGFTPITGVISSSDTVLIALEKLQYAISTTVFSGGSLQSVVNNGNGISNYNGNGTASIQSTNFVNNRTLYLNKDEFPTIKIVDNLDSAHNLTIDLDTLTLNGTSYSWSTITSPIPSATTVAVTADLEVGGIAAQQVIPIGTTLQTFVEDLLTKVYNPLLIAPTFSLTNNAGVREIGSTASSSNAFNLTFNFYAGNIQGATVGGIWVPGGTQGTRAGSAISYTINGITQSSNVLSVSPTFAAGGNIFYATVTYGVGIQPLNSKGLATDDLPFPAGTSAQQQTTIQGIYPYFWWKSASPITAAGMQTAIANGSATKVVGISTGTISITFAATGQYLAFAYPETSTTKTIWFVTSLNSGSIPGGVFGSATVLSCDSPTSFWSGIDYKIHVTAGLITESAQMQLRNS